MDHENNTSRNTGLEVTGVTHDGRGVVRAGGKAVFVPGVWPGEICTIRIVEDKKRFALGEMVSLDEPSPYRIESPCPHPECGACAFLTLRYPAQLELKQEMVTDALIRIGGTRDPEVLTCIGMKNPEAWRNKVRFHAGEQDGKPVLGFFTPGTNNPVAVPDCLLLMPGTRRIYHLLLDALDAGELVPAGMPGGFLEDVVVRESGTLLVRFGTGEGGRIPESLVLRLRDGGAGIVQEAVIAGKGKEAHRLPAVDLVRAGDLEETFEGLEFRFSPEAFAQVNTRQAAVLYKAALDAAGPLDGRAVLDLYCGAGFLGLLAAGRGARSVTGIEISRSAVRDAEANAREQGVQGTGFLAGPAWRLLPRVIRERRPDVVFIDPPRAGIEAAALDALVKAVPERVVYVSCDQGTFARDAKRLLAAGYRLEQVRPVDMFPFTHHVEVVGVFLS